MYLLIGKQSEETFITWIEFVHVVEMDIIKAIVSSQYVKLTLVGNWK